MEKVDCWYIKGGLDEAEHREQAENYLGRIAPEYRGELLRFKALVMANKLIELGYNRKEVPLLALVGREGKIIGVMV